MRKHLYLKRKAILLRKKGLSYNEIRKQINIAKSTLSLWLRDIRLNDDHRERLYNKRIHFLSFGPRSQKERRQREVEEIIKSAMGEMRGKLSAESFRLFGAALYCAEGSKGGVCQFTNSDPSLISFMVKWFRDVFNIKVSDMKARLNIYSIQDEKIIKKFWSDLTGIPMSNFGKSYIKVPGSGFKKNKWYYGTMRLEIPKSVDIKHRIFGWVLSVFEIQKSDLGRQRRWQATRILDRSIPINLLK